MADLLDDHLDDNTDPQQRNLPLLSTLEAFNKKKNYNQYISKFARTIELFKNAFIILRFRKQRHNLLIYRTSLGRNNSQGNLLSSKSVVPTRNC